MYAVLVMLMAGLASGAVVKPEARLAPALDSTLPGVQWCSSTVYCPSCSSCCRRPDGSFGCCGSNMVCCADGFHCCPYGTRCDVTSRTCSLGSNGPSFPSILQQAASVIDSPQLQVLTESLEMPLTALEPSEPSVVWCDFRTYCSDCTTCCQTPTGIWSCCIYSNGRCCADGLHCCPYGYTCDSTSRYCKLGAVTIPSARQRLAVTNNSMVQEPVVKKAELEKAAPMPVDQGVETSKNLEIVRCNARYGCPASNTCCKKLDGQWGCCPYKEAQCCEDGQHCCEAGYECDGSVSCKKGMSRVPAALKEEPLEL